MTPLAHRITKELTLPAKRRTFVDGCGLLQNMRDVHCFDLSSVTDLLQEMSASAWEHNIGIDDTLAFLPAPRTWIEWQVGDSRWAVLLEQTRAPVRSLGSKTATVMTAVAGGAGHCFFSPAAVFTMRLDVPSFPCDKFLALMWPESLEDDQYTDVLVHYLGLVPFALALINTPRIIGRRQHMPHRGLERALLSQKKVIGSFPLHAWTEIILEVTPPREADGEHEFEAHLTGRRALHFVRAHLRIRGGTLEFVKSHWRGDAALGIRQSRYVLKEGRT
jgi:hypothetical protein